MRKKQRLAFRENLNFDKNVHENIVVPPLLPTCSIDPDFFAISHSELEIGSKILQNEFSTAVHKERILNPHNELLMRRFQHHLQDPEP